VVNCLTIHFTRQPVKAGISAIVQILSNESSLSQKAARAFSEFTVVI
jgi:hypothetical protein